MLQNYDTILFDADRTLFDTAACEKTALKAVLKTLGAPFSEDMPQIYSQINEALWQKIETGEVSPQFCPNGTLAKIFGTLSIYPAIP